MLIFTSFLFLVANYCGVGYTNDSYSYVRIAEQIADQGFLFTDGFNIKPPIYPLVISWIGTERIAAYNLILLLVSASTLYYLSYEINSKILQILFLAFMVFSTPLYLVHSFAWTEPTFITVLLIAFLTLHQYQKTNKTYLLFTGISLLMVLPFIRFAGIFILTPTFLILLLYLPPKIRRFLWGVIGLSTVTITFWVLLFEEGFLSRWHTFTAPFRVNIYTRYVENLDAYLQALGLWVSPLKIYKPIRLLAGSSLLILILFAAARHLQRSKSILRGGVPLIFIIYYILLHTVFSVEYYSAERYLTPFYNLIILSLLLWLDDGISNFSRNAKKLAVILLGMLLLYHSGRTIKNVLFWNQVRCGEMGLSQLRQTNLNSKIEFRQSFHYFPTTKKSSNFTSQIFDGKQ